MANTVFNQSSIFSGITWETGSKSFLPAAEGSDLWNPAWAHDGNIYTSWGDGGGFTGTNCLGRTHWGIARVQGASYAARSAYNVYGGNSAEASEAPLQPNTPNSNPFGTPNNWKLDSFLAVNSVLYGIMFDWAWYLSGDYYRWRVIKSTDLSQTWRMTNGASLDQTTWTVTSVQLNAQGHPFLFEIGQNNALTPNSGYIFGCWVTSGRYNYATRVPIAGIGNPQSYQFHTGSGTWTTSRGQAEIKFEFNIQGDTRMWYLAQYSRYFMTFQSSDGKANWYLLDAPDPWGPWTKVGNWTDWIDSTNKFGYRIVDKWVSSGNNEVALFYSGVSSYDNFATVKGTLSLYSGGSGTAPQSYSVSSWNTYTGSQSWVREVDGADIADATVSHLALFDQIVAGQIAAGAIGAAEIAAGTIVASHVVVGGMNGATIIASGTITTNQIGVNELIAHTANIKDAVVTTLKIGENQVTVPVFSIVDSSFNCNSNVGDPTFLVDATINAIGYPVIISFEATVWPRSGQTIVFAPGINSGGIPGQSGRVLFGLPEDMPYMPVAFSFMQTPNSGTQTYQMYAYGVNTPRVTKPSLTLLGCKR